MRVLFGGGSTGGHLYPALVIACALRAIDSSTDALFAATANGLDRRILAASGERFVPVAAGPVSGASILRAACSLARQPLWIAEARRVIRRFSANVVIGTGGQVSGPLLVAARLERIPTLLVELNVVPGRSNRFAVRLASAAAAGWSETAGRLGARAFVSGVPVRAAFFTVPPPTDDHRLRVAVIGGSAGSARLNRAVQQALPRLATLRDRITVVAHAAGEAGEAEMRRAYAAEGFTAEVHRYVHDMAAAYIQCNAVIAHAGASTCSELAASGRPSILVPLDASAGRHQCANADAMAAAGAAMLVCDNAAAGDDGRRCHWAAGSWSPCSDVAVGAGAGASPRRRGDCRTRNRPRRTVVSTIISSRRAYEITKPDLFRVFQLSWRARGRSLAHGVTRGGSGFVNPTFPLQFYAVDALSPYREHLLYPNVGLTVSNFGLGTVVAPDGSAAYYATVDAVYEMSLNPPSGQVSILFFLGVFGLSQDATLTGFDSTGTYFNIIDGAVAYHLFPGTQAVTVQQFPPAIGHAVSAAFRRSPWGGVRIEPHEGVTTTESGATGTFTAVLTAPPLADVSVSFSSSRSSEGAVSPASVVYTTGNWNVPRTITVTGVDDVANDGNQPYAITSTTTSVDANYSGRTVLPVSVTNLEVNHLPGLTAASHSVRQGNASATVTLGSASDIETAAGALALSSVSVPGGVTIGTIGNSNGTFTAPLSASCTAPTGAQALTLRVTDGAGASPMPMQR